MPLSPFKFIIQAVLLETDSDGKPVGEKISEPMPVYGVEGLEMFIDNMKAQLDENGCIPEERPEIVVAT